MVSDKSRFKKTYSFYRQQPVYETSGGGGGGTTIVSSSCCVCALSFTSTSMSGSLLTFRHGLDYQYVNISIYDNNGDVVVPDSIEASSLAITTVDLSSYATIPGTWHIMATAPEYVNSFTNASLSGGTLTVNHGLTSQYVSVAVYDDSDLTIIPDEITATSAGVATVDLTSFGPIPGTWNVIVSETDNVTTFTNSDLSLNKLTVNHGISSKYVNVNIFDDSDNLILPDVISTLGTGSTEIDLSSFSPLPGTWHAAFASCDYEPSISIGGSGGTACVSPYTMAFDNSDLVGGFLTVNHGFSAKYVNVIVYNGSDKVIIPDDIIATSAGVTTIDLGTFGSIAGTWHVTVVESVCSGGGGGGSTSPGSPNKSVQFNDGGVFGGNNNFTFDETSVTLFMTGSTFLSSSNETTLTSYGMTRLSGSHALEIQGLTTVTGSVIPEGDRNYDLGTPTNRWANIYTGDLHLRNDKGDWTIVEEEDFLMVVNNKTKKKYKMALIPFDIGE